MSYEYGIILASLIVLGFVLSCGIFCAWFDHNQSEIKRRIAKKNREYFKNE